MLYVCTRTRRIESKSERTTSRILQRTVYIGKRNACTDASEKSAVKSPPSNVKESLASETVHGMDQKSDQPFLSIIDQLRKSDRRIDEIEFAVNKMGAYVEEPLTDFRESLTEAIKDSREKMMRCFDKPL